MGRAWPVWEDPGKGKRFPGLLGGLDAALWGALGRLEPSHFRGAKQPPVRTALAMLGLDWIATNTTPNRIALGNMFDKAKEAHEAGCSAGSSRKRPADVPTEAVPLPEACHFEGPLERLRPSAGGAAAAHRLQDRLREHGAVLVRRAVELPPDAAAAACARASSTKQHELRPTVGDGREGRYCEVGGYESLQAQVQEVACAAGGAGAGRKKALLLQYREGGENWAHQDACGDPACPLQALLLLSRPAVDFTGGQFYVARAGGEGLLRHEVELSHAGDLVIFMADTSSGWFHGMLPVQRGSAEVCSRVAVGLLQAAA